MYEYTQPNLDVNPFSRDSLDTRSLSPGRVREATHTTVIEPC